MERFHSSTSTFYNRWPRRCWFLGSRIHFARSGIEPSPLSTGTTFAYPIPTVKFTHIPAVLESLKVDQLAERIKLINPSCIVHAQRAFYTPENSDELILPNMNYVLDAIDRKNTKIHLINHCRQETTFQLSHVEGRRSYRSKSNPNS